MATTLDQNRAVVLVMLDFSAAFGTIDQGQLLYLLETDYGVAGTALSWFRIYLEGRTQRIQIDSEMADCIPLHFGVRQGLVLGPVMFTLYTAPMQRIIRKHGIEYHKYADDIQLYTIFDPCIPGDRERAVEGLTACVKELRQWMVAHWLKLNDDKTEMIMFMSKYHLNRYRQCSINIGDSTITPAHHARKLGVQVDQHLSMVPNVTAICASCNYHLYRLSSIRRYLTVNATRTVVQALITSRLDYCNSLMVNIPPTHMERLQKIQNNAAS